MQITNSRPRISCHQIHRTFHLARQRSLPALQRGDLLAICTTGPYCYSMASQYNAQPRPAEVLVTGTNARIIRHRETFADLELAGY